MTTIKDNMNGGIKIAGVIPQIKKEDYYIHPKLQRDLDGVIATLSNIDKFGKEMGNRNYILTGPPGVGKTLGVKYIASVLQMPVYDGKMLMNAQGISQFYAQLRENAKQRPVIVVINELDKFSSRDEIVDPMQQQTLNQLLDEMEGQESNNNIFVFGTTNKPNRIDDALRRPGRFSEEIYFMPPDMQGRLEILKIHAKGKGGHKFKVADEELQNAAKVTYGYTGADLVGLLNKAFTNALLDKRTDVNHGDVEYALTKTKPSALRDMPFSEPSKKFSNMAGYEMHKALLKKLVENSHGTNMLYYGPKGTGKTVFAEALAGEYGFNYILVSGSEPEDKFVGETGKTIDKYLERAKQLAPCVLVFDEMDSLVEKRGIESHKSSWSGLLQSKLNKPMEDVYIIATVNRPDLLKPAFRDRFIHKLYFGMPSKEEQEKIWTIYLKDKLNGEEIKKLTETNNKLSGRDIYSAFQKVADYGAEHSFDLYQTLIKDIKPDFEVNYPELVKMIGNSVDDYASVQSYVKK